MDKTTIKMTKDMLTLSMDEISVACASVGISVPVDKMGKMDLIHQLICAGITSADQARALKKPEAVAVVTAPAIDPDAIRAEIVAQVTSILSPLRERLLEAPEAAQTLFSGVVERKTCLDVFGLDLRDVMGNPLMVDMYDCGSAPAVDPDYVWQSNVLHMLLCGQDGHNVWLSGDRSVGKTSAAIQFAARTRRPITRINFHRGMDAMELFGSKSLKDGSTFHEESAFTSGFQVPGMVLLLDEPTNARSECVAQLNAFLEPNCAVSYGDKTYRRANGVVVVACDNTTGNRDNTGRFVGTQPLNAALIDRFGFSETVTWLDPWSEAKVYVARTGCPLPVAEEVVKIWNVSRAQTGDGLLVDAPSVRNAVAFITGLSRGLPTATAWRSAVVNKQPAESAAQLQTIFDQFVKTVNWQSKFKQGLTN
jgi:MoxR-like ATPase